MTGYKHARRAAGGAGGRGGRRPSSSRAAGGLSFAGPEAWREVKDFMPVVVGYCDELDERLQRQYPGVPGMRLKAHHETDSRRSRPGFPDLWICGPGGLDVVELKIEAVSAQPTEAQQEWLDVLMLAGIAAYVWRPSDWLSGAIQNELARLARPRPGAAALAARMLPVNRRCGCAPGAAHTCPTWGAPS